MKTSKAYLVKIEAEGFESERYEITLKPLMIGRNKQADVMVLSRKVSRLHCVVTLQQNGEYTIADLMSTNGTKVNGEKVQEAPLKPWDRISVGDATFVFKLHHATAEEPL